MTDSSTTFDVLILGGGPGGYVAAMRAAQLGLRAAVIEREKLGGSCTNWGCIPSKALLHSAELLLELEDAASFGVHASEVRGDYGQALRRARSIVDRQAKGVAFLMRKYQAQVVAGTGRLVAANRVQVTNAQGTSELEATRGIILATGARVRWLPGLHPDGERIISSREVWDLEDLPGSILLLGGGPIGCEFATVFNAFGSKVTLVEYMPSLLPREDSESSAALTKAFRKRGIDVRTGTTLLHAEAHTNGVHVQLAPSNQPEAVSEHEFDRVMVSAGFAPNSEDLGLEELGVQVDSRGYITVDERMQTTVPGIYAIGDVTGLLPLAHVAEAQGQLAIEALAGVPLFPLDYNAIPRATYSIPQVASIGLREDEATAKGLSFQVTHAPFLPNGKARAIGATVGQVKLLVEDGSGEILGAHMVGPEVTELINEAALARRLEATSFELGRSIHAHPSLGEVLAEAALESVGTPIAS